MLGSAKWNAWRCLDKAQLVFCRQNRQWCARYVFLLPEQAGKPVAFFVSKNGASDGIDSWVASVLNAGFGTGGEAAEIEVLNRIAQVQSQYLQLSIIIAPCNLSPVTT